ncbi:IS1634 family transposase, partial [Pseudactinotalea sp. Z1739]
VLARLIEPASKLATIGILEELGVDAPHRNTIGACLKRINAEDYRSQIAQKCFAHATSHGDISLILYDVTTLYFEAEHEDDLRKVGYSKERRIDPQIVVGLLVDRGGFPLEIGCFEGNHAETHTLLPIIEQFQDRHNIEDMVIVADAGMLSQANLEALDEAKMRFIVGSRTTKAPGDLARHFHWHGDAFDDGQVIDTITPRSGGPRKHDTAKKAEPVWDPVKHPKAWRAIWQYSRRRATRDTKTITTQENRALAIINGEVRPKNARFITTTKAGRELDVAALDRARRLVGLKGYQTNIPATMMPAGEVIASYHDLWQVEASFRMSKSDLRARPIFHRTRDSIEAHLTIVFTALALARYMQAATGLSLKKIITTLRPIRAALIRAGGQTHKLPAYIPPETAEIINQITEKPGH